MKEIMFITYINRAYNLLNLTIFLVLLELESKFKIIEFSISIITLISKR